MSKITFSNENVFYRELKQNVDLYFAKNNINKSGSQKLYVKTFVLISCALSLYFILIFSDNPPLIEILFCIILAFSLAGIGFNVMHDACHGSFSSKKWVNNLFGYTLNALGGNSHIWKSKHLTHHTFTNVDGKDDDIAKSPLLRQCESQRWLPFHRYQHIYIVLLYATSTIAWVFIFDFTKYFTRRLSGASLNKMKLKDHVIFWLSKLVYILFYILIPVIFKGGTRWAVGFLIVQVVIGYILALVFQLAHVVENTCFQSKDEISKSKKSDWAEHQVYSSANFSSDNKFLNWYLGGLNFQIEHHLFQKISHVHYPQISKIVKETCFKFGLPYNYFPTMVDAINSHFRVMRKLGKRPEGLQYNGTVFKLADSKF